MKTLPAPAVPGKTEAEKFDNAVRKMFSVSKDELLRRESRLMRTPTKRTKKLKQTIKVAGEHGR
jgi:hypothetical protein